MDKNYWLLATYLCESDIDDPIAIVALQECIERIKREDTGQEEKEKQLSVLQWLLSLDAVGKKEWVTKFF